MQMRFNTLLEIVLNLCAQVIKMNLRGEEEMQLVLEDLGLDAATQKNVLKVYKTHYLTRMGHINTAYDKEDESNPQVENKVLKKFPLNFAASDDGLSVSNPKLVDIEWEVIYALSSKNLNKVFQPRFQITLTMLTQQGGSLQQGASSFFPWTSKRNHLKLKRVQFECDQAELTHMIQKVKQATNSLEQLVKEKK